MVESSGPGKRRLRTMTTEQKVIRVKVRVLELAKQLGNVSQACRVMGYSRNSFHGSKNYYPAPMCRIITPYTPGQNGIVERFFRSLKEECVWQHNFGDSPKPEPPLLSGFTGTMPRLGYRSPRQFLGLQH